MHPIQSHILNELMRHPHRRYSDLKQDEVDSTLFMYHFRKLLGMGLVAKTSDGYVLTPEGIRHAGRISATSSKTRLQPTISTFIACQNDRAEWLLHTRAYQPFLGCKGFPYGKLHWGESLEEAARRELADKTGLEAELIHKGNMYLKVWEGEELITHMLCHVFLGTDPRGELKVEGPKGKPYWEHVEDPDMEGYLPGFPAIFSLATGSSTPIVMPEIEIRLTERYPWPDRDSAEGNEVSEF